MRVRGNFFNSILNLLMIMTGAERQNFFLLKFIKINIGMKWKNHHKLGRIVIVDVKIKNLK